MSQDGADTLATIRKWAWVWRWARDMCHTRGARLRPTTPVIITNSHCRTSKTILQKYFICQNYLKLACHWLVGDDHWGGGDKNKVTDVNDDTNDEDDDEVSWWYSPNIQARGLILAQHSYQRSTEASTSGLDYLYMMSRVGPVSAAPPSPSQSPAHQHMWLCGAMMLLKMIPTKQVCHCNYLVSSSSFIPDPTLTFAKWVEMGNLRPFFLEKSWNIKLRWISRPKYTWDWQWWCVKININYSCELEVATPSSPSIVLFQHLQLDSAMSSNTLFSVILNINKSELNNLTRQCLR